MREILFLGKRIDNGEWAYGSLILWDDGSCSIESGKLGQPMIAVERNTIGQYTGLTDKNGKKIFEGDIVKHYNHFRDKEAYQKGLIYFDSSRARYKRTSTPEDVYLCDHCCYEVIGNIYDNPELLEDAT